MFNAALSQDCKFIRHSNAVAAGATDVEPATGVDMAGFNAVCFIVSFGAIVAGAVTGIRAQCSTESDGATDTFADIAGTAVAVADDDDDQVAYLDIINPPERYVRCVVDRATQNATVDGIVAILYQAHTAPTVHDSATVVGGELHIGKAEGTA